MRHMATNNDVVKRYIYHLIDPRNGKVFYVGQTVNPGQRLQEHVKADKGMGEKKILRIEEILLDGTYPVMKTIKAITGTYAEACAVEKEEISKFPYSQLTNGKGAR